MHYFCMLKIYTKELQDVSFETLYVGILWVKLVLLCSILSHTQAEQRTILMEFVKFFDQTFLFLFTQNVTRKRQNEINLYQ